MFLQPERVPVKVYLSTDKDAPRLDRTAGSLQTILKACLVTGYGDKEPAGWSLPFEDTAKGIKVFRPEISPHTDFFMKVSNDDGREATIQVLQNMTSVDNGTIQIDKRLSYLYQSGNVGKWAVIATSRSMWVLCEAMVGYHAVNKQGCGIFCGDVTKDTKGERAVGVCALNGFEKLETFAFKGVTQFKAVITSTFDGVTNHTANLICSPMLITGNDVHGLPAYFASHTGMVNYQKFISHGREFMAHSIRVNGTTMILVPTDYWEY